MSDGFPVTVAVTRPDGSVEHVRVGTAVKRGEGFSLQLGEMSIGGRAEASAATSAPRRAAAAGEPVFPPYGRSKGGPIAGATMQDLEYYAKGCRRTLDDPGKARWHEKEKVLLAAIEAEIAKQGGGGGGGGGGGRSDEAPPPGDEDAPF
jgi:hypothetical protein